MIRSVATILAGAPPTGRPAPEWRRDLEVLVAHTCGIGRPQVLAHPEHILSVDEIETLETLVGQRRRGVPVAYLVGHREFWSLDLIVTPATLIPRPETELLVERALVHMPVDGTLRVADIGTGSGAIALALARERPRAEIFATDPSAPALAVACQNARAHGAHGIQFLNARGVSALPGLFDLIVSNPPYIAAADPCLQEPDLAFEPLDALQGGPSGLDILTEIIREAHTKLRPRGHLLLEHGATQKASVHALLKAHGFTSPICHQDLAGWDRVTEARLHG